jgi:hypothetical protein
MSTILEHPDAQALLGQTDVCPETVRACGRPLTRFVQRYLPLFYRDEQRAHAETILKGKLTGLERKTTEPIATQARQRRRPLQHFVGAGRWDDDAVRAELRRHVGEELADPEAVLVVDNYGVAKKGDDSCGVARQWCGHLVFSVRGSRPSLARPGQSDHRVRLLHQRPAVEAAADLVAREAGGAQQQFHLGLVRPPHEEL